MHTLTIMHNKNKLKINFLFSFLKQLLFPYPQKNKSLYSNVYLRNKEYFKIALINPLELVTGKRMLVLYAFFNVLAYFNHSKCIFFKVVNKNVSLKDFNVLLFIFNVCLKGTFKNNNLSSRIFK